MQLESIAKMFELWRAFVTRDLRSLLNYEKFELQNFEL